jgi:hypothetical protein
MSGKRKRGDDSKKKGSSNYQTIQGKKYDRGMITVVVNATQDKEKLDVEDCKKLLVEIVDGNVYTDIEKATMKYIRENYKFEPEADQWIRNKIARFAAIKSNKEKDHKAENKKEEKEQKLLCSCNEPDDGTLQICCDSQLAGCYNWYHVRCVGVDKDNIPDVWFCDNCNKKAKKTPRGKKAAAKKDSYYKQIDNKKYDKGMLDAADAATSGKGDGRVSIADAKTIFQEAVDGDRITECEYETLDYIKKTYQWTDKALAWLDKALAKWEEDHPRKKTRTPRATKEKKEKKEEKKSKGKKAKGKPKKKAKTEKEDEEEGAEEDEEKATDDKKENGDKVEA